MKRAESDSALLGLLGGLTLALAAGVSPGAAQQPAPPGRQPDISVSASGSVQVRPDQAVLLLAIETTAKDAQDAARQNASKMQRILDAVKKLGVPADRIRTVSYSLDPEYARQQPTPEAGNQEPRIVGYRASNMVQVTLDDIEKVGSAIDAGVGAGANRVAGLSYGVKDESVPRLEALRRAMQSARAQAGALAEAAGRQLGPLLHVSTGEGISPPRPMLRMAAQAMEMIPPPPTPTEPGELTVTATVVASFALAGER